MKIVSYVSSEYNIFPLIAQSSTLETEYYNVSGQGIFFLI